MNNDNNPLIARQIDNIKQSSQNIERKDSFGINN